MIILTWTLAQSVKSKYELPSRTWTQHLGVDHTKERTLCLMFLYFCCVHFKFQSNEGRWKMSEWRDVDFSSWRGTRALMSLTRTAVRRIKSVTLLSSALSRARLPPAPPRTSARTPQVGSEAPSSVFCTVSFPHRPVKTRSLSLSRYSDALRSLQLPVGLLGCGFSSFRRGLDAFIHRGVSQSWQLWYNEYVSSLIRCSKRSICSSHERVRMNERFWSSTDAVSIRCFL